jgi:hypothetical protein
MVKNDWSLSNVPPKNDPDVGEFAFSLFEAAKNEKERLGKHDDFNNNFALYRGNQDTQQSGRKGAPRKKKVLTPINLYFANVERTVSNITAREPTGEVVDLDGQGDGSENILSIVLKKWWKDTNQQSKTRASSRQMEIYGFTSEKPYWDKGRFRPDIAVTDPYSIFPCPGNWDNIAEEAPYICYAYIDFVSSIESIFKVKDIAKDDAYDLMGTVRETYKTQGYGIEKSIGNYTDAMTVTREVAGQDTKILERCLVIEVWLRDDRETEEKTEEPFIDENGAPQVRITTIKKKVYRDGIRKITISKSKDPAIKSGIIILDDNANPNLNPELADELASTTYPWGRLPCYVANSYKDGVTIYGFAAAEQVGDLIVKINLIFSKLINYVINVMAPPLIVQQHCGITKEMIENSISKPGRMVLMPTIPNARIEFMQIPNLPETFFRVLELLIRNFDRIYAIEDADRGQAPNGVIAYAAIQALQERNQVLMLTTTSSVDFLAEERSKWAIGLYQNFGTRPDSVNVADEQMPFAGVEFAGRKFGYVVESGSSTPRTKLQWQDLALKLKEMGVIDQQATLESIGFPGWKEILERNAESQTEQALQVLVDAGLPEETAIQLRDFVMQSSLQTQGQKKK